MVIGKKKGGSMFVVAIDDDADAGEQHYPLPPLFVSITERKKVVSTLKLLIYH